MPLLSSAWAWAGEYGYLRADEDRVISAENDLDRGGWTVRAQIP